MCEATLFKCKLLFCTVGKSGVVALPAWVCVCVEHRECNQCFYEFFNIV